MSDTTALPPTPISPAARVSILSYARYRTGLAHDSAAEAVAGIGQAVTKLVGRGLSHRDLKGMDDAAQLVADAKRSLWRASEILGRVAAGEPLAVEVAPEQAEPGGTHDLGGEGG